MPTSKRTTSSARSTKKQSLPSKQSTSHAALKPTTASRPKKIKAASNIELNGRARPIIERVTPEIDGGQFAIKRVPGERVRVEADIYGDGHDKLKANLCVKEAGKEWVRIPLQPLTNDRWGAELMVSEVGTCLYTIEAWVDHFVTWRSGFEKKHAAGQDLSLELKIGREIIEMSYGLAVKAKDHVSASGLAEMLARFKSKSYEDAVDAALSEALSELMMRYPDKRLATTYPTRSITVDPPYAVFSTWYEFFPRSFGDAGTHGSFRSCEALLPEIQKMGFDVIYLPPIHPIGMAKRKGKNNSLTAALGEPGSPWAIGSPKGGHKAIHPELGSLKDFRHFVEVASSHGIRVALDIAFQCSPDHPYCKDHREWFRPRPDGTLQYAENPPKKYEDVVPFDFESEAWMELWKELKQVFEHWIENGVRIFRVDNPHTKPLQFWDWCIRELKATYPDVIFLSEAFTRPKIMYRLAKGGFSQSYTYFTWRNEKQSLTEYLTELTTTEVKEYFRPNFWPNTPDILSEEFLHYAPPAAFALRYVLAATLSSNIGIYGPAYELCINQPLIKGKEEYLDSEKYEIKSWEWNKEGNIRPLITRVNHIRKENPALQKTNYIRFLSVNQGYSVENPYLIAYLRYTEDQENVLLVIVNHDPHHAQSGWVYVPIQELGLSHSFAVKDLLDDEVYQWKGDWNFVELTPSRRVAHIFKLK